MSKTVIELAREAGFWRENINTWMCSTEDIELFAELVRADATAAIEGLERSGIWITREEAIAAIKENT